MKIILVYGTAHRTGLKERNPTDLCMSLLFLGQGHHKKVKVDQGIKTKSKLFQQLKKMGKEMSCDVYALLLQKAPPRLSQCTGLPLPGRLFYTSVHQFQEVRGNAPCLKLFCHYYFLYQEMAKSFTHLI